MKRKKEQHLNCWSCNAEVAENEAIEASLDHKTSMVFCSQDCEDMFIHFSMAQSIF